MKKILIVFLLVISGYNFPQNKSHKNLEFGNIRFDLFTVEQGLSSSVIYSINQDKSGFLWIGTGEGLNRFDGYNFKTFKHTPFDSTSISDNWVLSLLPDSRGDLWIGTHNGGLNRFDESTGKFEQFRFELNNISSISSDRVWDITEEKPGYLWVSTSGGLCYFDVDRKKFTRYAENPAVENSLPGNSVNKVFIDSKGNRWVGIFGSGIVKIVGDGNDAKFVYPQLKNAADEIRTAMIKVITEDANGNLWFGTYREGLYRLNTTSGNVLKFLHDPERPASIAENSVFGLAFDEAGNLWVGTHDEGVSILPVELLTVSNSFEAEFITVKHDPVEVGSLSNNSAIALFRDNNNLMWIGTDKGINKYNPFRARFLTIAFKELGINRSTGSFVKSAFQDSEGEYWFGTYNDGLYRYNKKNGNVLRYVTSGNNRNGLSNNTVWAILEEKKGEYWFGTSYGLNYYVENENKFKHYFRDDNSSSLSHNNISALYNFSDNYMFVGTWGGGLNVFNKENGVFYKYSHDYDDDRSLSSNVIKSFFVDKEGNLWIATFGGGLNFVSALDLKLGLPRGLKFSHFKHDRNNRKSLSSDNVTFITETSTGELWCGTFGGGLNQILIERNNTGAISNITFNSFLEEDGLADNTVFNLLTDHQDNIWASTNRGISKYDVKLKTFFNYDKKDGLQDNEFDQGACIDNEGNLVFGGTSGINVFNPVNLISGNKKAPLAITSVKKFTEGSVDEFELNTKTRVNIEYSDYYFVIEFAALDLTRPEKNQYAYKMEGFDDDWIMSGNRNSVRYTNLDGGDYTFRIRGTDSEGVWNSEIASLAITVSSPPWSRWWAFLIYGLILLSMIFGFIRFAGREQRRELKLRQRELEMERKVSRQLREEEKLKETLFKISEAVSESPDMDVLFTKVHEIIQSLVHAKNLYIALYDSKPGTIEFPYYIDERDQLSGKKIPPQKLGNSLTEYLIKKGEPLLMSDSDFNKLINSGEVSLIGAPSKEWLGVPLKDREGVIIGALVIQNYTNELIYTDRDLEILTFVSNQIGIAIERKKNEDVKNKYDFIVNTSDSFMTMIDRDFNYVAVNEAFCFRHKKTRDEIVGKKVSELWGATVFDGTIKNHLIDAFGGKSVSYQAWFDNKDGDTGCFEVEYYPYHNEDDYISHVVVVTRDITELIKAEETVNKLLRAVEQAGDVIFMTTMEGTITYANPAFEIIYGYRIDEVIGDNPRILRSGKTRGEYYKKMWETILDGKTFRGELLNKTKSGDEIAIEMTISPIFDSENHLMGYISVQSDITKRKEVESKIVESKELAEKTARLKSEFLSQMSHEIRTPLNSIINMVELVEDELGTNIPDSSIENLEYLRYSAGRILRTVHLILDMSEVQSGLVTANLEDFNVCELFDRIIEESKILTKGKKIEFTHTSLLDFCNIKSDKYFIEQIFINLLDNAFKFTPDGSINITLSGIKNKLFEITITDTGIGIGDNFTDKLFDPFTQEDNSNSRPYEGTGIGLALVKKYTEILKGEISFTSDKGVGTSFTVKIPV